MLWNMLFRKARLEKYSSDLRKVANNRYTININVECLIATIMSIRFKPLFQKNLTFEIRNHWDYN